METIYIDKINTRTTLTTQATLTTWTTWTTWTNWPSWPTEPLWQAWMIKRFIMKINAEFALFTWSCLFMIWHCGNVTLPLNMLATGLSENIISNQALSLAAALTLKYFFIQFLLLDALNSRPQCTMDPLVSERPLQKLKIPRKYPHQSSLWSRRIPDYFWASILQNILNFRSSQKRLILRTLPHKEMVWIDVKDLVKDQRQGQMPTSEYCASLWF